MCSHVFQTFIQPSQHVRKVLATHKVACSGCIESSGNGFQEAVVLEVLAYTICEPCEPLLLGDEVLALALERCSLSSNGFEGIRQLAEDIKS